MRLRRCALIAAGAGALLLAASPAIAAPRTYTVVIDKMKFGPLPAQLRKGDAIVWVNRDFLRHSATAADRSFDAIELFRFQIRIGGGDVVGDPERPV